VMARTAKQVSPPNSHPLWRDGIEDLDLEHLNCDLECDVAVIGGGFSGLWSAYHLINHDPSLKIAVFEAEKIGFGASGRNGGWVSADYPVDAETLKRRYPDKDVSGFLSMLRDGVNEIGDFARNHAPRSHYRKSGALLFATNEGQLRRLEGSVDDFHYLLDRDQTHKKVAIDGALASLFTPECATVNPMGLLFDLAELLSRKGVRIFQDSRAEIVDGALRVNGHPIRSTWRIRATEAYSPKNRSQIPLYSLMIATRGLTTSESESIDWEPGLAIAEATRNVNYVQMTSDFKIAAGGRGARYPFGSRRNQAYESETRTHDGLTEMLKRWFPVLARNSDPDSLQVTHHWGGAIAIRRNWESYISVDKERGEASLGGYVGDGMTMSYLAARAVAKEIVTGEKSWSSIPISTESRARKRWPIEPFRYLGANAMISSIQRADERERLGKRSRLIDGVERLLGK
jgi:glycine/D-amino acid oxidase-like deaminating enzyme